MDYSTFLQRSSEDEAFIHCLESNVEKIWKIDLADWEFCHQGIEDWI